VEKTTSLCCSMYFCVVLCMFCVVLRIFVLFYVFLCCSMYVLCCSMYFCVVLCIFVFQYFCVVLRIFCVVLCICVLFYVCFVLFYVFFVLFYVFFVLFYVFFVLFYVFLCCSTYCLFCVVLCIVCVYMCTVLLPPGGYSIAVKYISYHEELNNLYPSPNIVQVIKSRRLRLAGHVARMGERKGVYRISVGKPEGKRPLGRLRRRWKDNIKMDLQ